MFDSSGQQDLDVAATLECPLTGLKALRSFVDACLLEGLRAWNRIIE